MSVAVIINSCLEFHKTTIPVIIESAKRANIPPQNIYVVVGECDYESDLEFCGDYNIVFCKYINVDYNGVIYFTQTERGLNELQKYDSFFYTHDTAEFLDTFWENIQKYANTSQYVKLEHISSKNMGILNVKWFIKNRKELLSYYINYDKNLKLKYKAGEFPNENFIYSKYNNIARWLNEDCIFLFENNQNPLGDVFPDKGKKEQFIKKYSEDERLATTYTEPGIILYQKNHVHSKGGWHLTL